jgi:hypothetical protein
VFIQFSKENKIKKKKKEEEIHSIPLVALPAFNRRPVKLLF